MLNTKKYTKSELVNFPFKNKNLALELRVNDLLGRLTLDEKLKLLHGRRFHLYDANGVKRLGIPFLGTTDGPIGVARHSSLKKNTRFPATIGLAATFNPKLAYEMGVVIGKETRATGNHIILAPGLNIDRTPVNGRTFEYMSEDPYLTQEMGILYVKGVQEQGISACIKHFVANNQEKNRMKINAEIDERTLHEIYLRAFIGTIKGADPWAVMTCYNKINGVYGSENKTILKDTLMDKYNFSGFAVTDWFASRHKEISTKDCIKAGLSLEMPKAFKYKAKKIKKVLSDGDIKVEDIDYIVRRILRTFIRVGLIDDKKTLPNGERNIQQHQAIAQKIAEESMVLLKNKKDILPLDRTKIKTISILGPNSNKKFGRFLYGGSSATVPPFEITPLKGLQKRCKELDIKINSSKKDLSDSDIVLLFLGLNHSRGGDAETKDKSTLDLPDEQIKLIQSTYEQNPNIVVVLINGSPITMEGWLEKVPAILEAWYPGMMGGNALVKILFGDISPSGKLPITFPEKLSDSPAHQSTRTYPGLPENDPKTVYYEEGIYVGYRHFDKENIEPLFPFGFGLSYTKFKYDNLKVDKNIISVDDKFSVTVDITNIGTRMGAEVVQIYVNDIKSSVDRPPKELAGFGKVFLNPDEKKTLRVIIPSCNFAFYDIESHDFKVETGEFKILVGSSSRNLSLETIIMCENNTL
ncbi:MAG: beta-glucosidase [Candidatus Kariarchaeaceae archaeon]|jgi:beta-glucosidase